MKITEFKTLLGTYGANIKRWPGVDPAVVKAFIGKSEQASMLYKEQQALDAALDSFAAPEVDSDLLERVMKRVMKWIDEQSDEQSEIVASLHPIKPANTEHDVVHPFTLWGRTGVGAGAGAAMALAAATVILFVYMPSVSVPVPVSSSSSSSSAAAQKENIFLAELDNDIEEENAEQEIMGLWEVAEASLVAPEDEIEQLLEEIFDDNEENSDLQEQMELWDLFLRGGTVEL